eukprot:6208362-Pleurochrysis_carterae.AAC.2
MKETSVGAYKALTDDCGGATSSPEYLLCSDRGLAPGAEKIGSELGRDAVEHVNLHAHSPSTALICQGHCEGAMIWPERDQSIASVEVAILSS